ncbi:MAG: glycosyltransferase family 4 protein [Bacteroidetes bacterium]|nr:glycosyltransferase family 4 protein [Bacteroidota bacterium]
MEGKKIKILLLADMLANTRQWVDGLERYGNAEVTVLELRNRNKLKRIAEWINILFTIRKKVRSCQPDIVIGYRLTSYGFLAAWSGFKPCVLASQGITDVWPEHHWTTPLKAALARYAIKRADMIHAWGAHMAVSIFELGAEEAQMFIMPRGIDTEIFSMPEGKENHTNGRTFTMCVTRGLYPEYNHIVILKAVKRLADEGFGIQLTIAGTGAEQENIQNFITANALEKIVCLTGYIPNKELPSLLQQSDIYLSMPSTEGVSASLLEAMSCGCFPIVSDIVANRVLVKTGENGYLAALDDVNDLCSKIKAIINNPDLFRNAVLENRDYVMRNASLKTNMPLFVGKYKELIIAKSKSVNHFAV